MTALDHLRRANAAKVRAEGMVRVQASGLVIGRCYDEALRELLAIVELQASKLERLEQKQNAHGCAA